MSAALRLRRVHSRGFALAGMMAAKIITGLAVLFLVGGFFAMISDDGRIRYGFEERHEASACADPC